MTRKKQHVATPEYDKVVEKVRNVQRAMIMVKVPELCRACRDEYDAKDHGFTDEYGNPDNSKDEDYQSIRNNYVKCKVMIDLAGVAYPDKAYIIKQSLGIQASGRYQGSQIRQIYERVERKEVPTRVWDRNQQKVVTEMRDNKGRGKLKKIIHVNYKPPKEPSETSKFVESVIEQEINSWK